jgi:hypothetical protein
MEEINIRQIETEALQDITNDLQEVVNNLVSLVGGKPVAKQKKSLAKIIPKKVAEAEPQEEVEPCLAYDEEEGGFGCLVCNEGLFKIGEAAEHVFAQHEILLKDIAVDPADALTHGRKWMMKKYLEKNAPDALEGYGRKAVAKPAKKVVKKPAVVKKTSRWTKKKEPAEETVKDLFNENFGKNLSGMIAKFTFDKQIMYGEILGEWKTNSKNLLVKRRGEILSVPKKNFILIKSANPSAS